MTAVKVSVTVVCFITFLIRFRDLRRLRSSGIAHGSVYESKVALTWVTLLLTCAVLLDVDPVYGAVDAVLGGHNFANLILRGITYALFFLAATVIARAFNSMLALWLVKGVPGRVSLIVTVSVTAGSFVFGGFVFGGCIAAYDSFAGWVYALIWQIYLAYLAIALLTCLLPAVMTPGGCVVLRVSAALIAIACLLAISYVPVRINEEALDGGSVLSNILKMATVVFVSAGSLTPWVTRRLKFTKP
ncbi:MAG: hypothetical protein B5766_10320 [Candidatus Lumbricidophila eiseniae]|uniref:Uncharacterized protein n=1 Tax=Candidatus Lumbricidiphila eiseniae TaxID=1969409 RepID=A0A2A6FPH8_9MICO|nr:MAG: hypothetical protein B5766_10320 [Candidatus Lumbricidophila eiseniae]